MSEKTDVIIVGAGLAGLAAAVTLHKAGKRVLVLEAEDRPGGRVKTDEVEGFLLDRGFQIYLDAYPEGQHFFDYEALDLRAFSPGAQIRYKGRFHRVADPYRAPFAALSGAFGPIGTLQDKLLVLQLREYACRGTLEELWGRRQQTTLQALRSFGFSDAMIERFFRPFYSGIFLESELATSSRMLDFTFRMFAQGRATLPAGGMEELPKQLVAKLPEEAIRCNTRIAKVGPRQVRTTDGEALKAEAVLVAVDGPAVAKLFGISVDYPGSCGTACLYFAAPESGQGAPTSDPLIHLNGEPAPDGEGAIAAPITNMCVPSNIVPGCASENTRGDRKLVSASTVGTWDHLDDEALEAAARDQLSGWFGSVTVGEWDLLRIYRIPNALPVQTPEALESPQRPLQVAEGVFLCGDHRANGSINGALATGRQAAEAILVS